MNTRPAIRKRSKPDLPGLAPWLFRAERLLIEAVRSVRLLGSVVPRNAAPERARLVEAFESGGESTPRWTYARTDHAALRKALARAGPPARTCSDGGSRPLGVSAYSSSRRFSSA